MKIYELYEDTKYYFIVMEFCEGGELLDFIAEKQKLDPKLAKVWFR